VSLAGFSVLLTLAGLGIYTSDAQPGWELVIGPAIFLPVTAGYAAVVAWRRYRQRSAPRSVP
jgi:hypothetical protein